MPGGGAQLLGGPPGPRGPGPLPGPPPFFHGASPGGPGGPPPGGPQLSGPLGGPPGLGPSNLCLGGNIGPGGPPGRPPIGPLGPPIPGGPIGPPIANGALGGPPPNCEPAEGGAHLFASPGPLLGGGVFPLNSAIKLSYSLSNSPTCQGGQFLLALCQEVHCARVDQPYSLRLCA